MPNETLSAALKEAYASAPYDVTVVDTLQFIHPDFIDQFGSPVDVFVVNDNVDLVATLEDASVQTFVRMRFDFVMPSLEEGGTPQASLVVDNVGRDLMNNIELAVVSTDLIQVKYRQYIMNDLAQPANDPPLSAFLINIKADIMRIKATLDFSTTVNRVYPRQVYSDTNHPGLFR